MVQFSRVDLASDCLQRYYSYDAAKDQFAIRALFCRAQIESNVSGLKGEVFAMCMLEFDSHRRRVFCAITSYRR